MPAKTNWPIGLQAFCQAYGSESPESAMRAACASLLEACGPMVPPIPLRPLLDKLDIRVRRVRREIRHPGQPDALLTAEKEGLTVSLYEGISARGGTSGNWRRTRFSLAHEIGHALLLRTIREPSLIASLDASPAAHRQLEGLCDIAAAEILLPARAVRNALRESDLSPTGLAKLYDIFLVSKEALTWRLAAVMPYSSVVKWRVYSRSDEESAEMRVVRSFPGYKRDGARPWLPTGCSTRHLDPPIVKWAASQREPVVADNLRLFLRGRAQECVGLATFFPADREPTKQPLFEGFNVPDETEDREEILLFVADKVMAGDATAAKFSEAAK